MLELMGPSSGEVSFRSGLEKMLVLCLTEAGPVAGEELEPTELDMLNLVCGSASVL